MGDALEQPAGEQPARPIVWAFCNGHVFGDQAWLAVTDDGVVLAEHVSSSEWWGARDVGPEQWPHRRQRYVEVLGTAEVDYRVLPLGQAPPDYVLTRVLDRAEAEDVAAAANAHVHGEPDPTERPGG